MAAASMINGMSGPGGPPAVTPAQPGQRFPNGIEKFDIHLVGDLAGPFELDRTVDNTSVFELPSFSARIGGLSLGTGPGHGKRKGHRENFCHLTPPIPLGGMCGSKRPLEWRLAGTQLWS